MSVTLDSTEQTIFNYLQARYPAGMRGAASDPTSVVYAYDVARAVLLGYYKENIEAGISRVIVQTADDAGLTEWESFLGIQTNEANSLAVRRGAVVAKLLGSNPTVGTIKSILTAVAGGDAQTVSIKELYLTSSNPDDIWTYEAHIYAPINGTYDETQIQNLLENIQPAHCHLIVVIIPVYTEVMHTHDSYATVTQTEFLWTDAANGPASTDGTWTDALPYLQSGSIWHDDGTYYPRIP